MKHLLGETSPGEAAAVQSWILAEPANQQYYNELKLVWENSRKLAASSTVDENKAWERFQHRIGQSTQSSREPVRHITRFTLFKMAASVLLVVGLGLIGWWAIHNNQVKEQFVSSTDSVREQTLPDGSLVTLNKRSSIEYPSRFKGAKRPVKLKGEAFFAVKPDKKKPFVISVDGIEVTVVGTSFNIRNEKDKTEVIVETGIVKVTTAGQSIELHAGERISISRETPQLKKEEVKDKLYNYYRTREFVCDETPLWKLVEVLNEAYDANIAIGRKEIRDLKINSTFVNEPLDRVLEVVTKTFSISQTRKGDKIILE